MRSGRTALCRSGARTWAPEPLFKSALDLRLQRGRHHRVVVQGHDRGAVRPGSGGAAVEHGVRLGNLGGRHPRQRGRRGASVAEVGDIRRVRGRAAAVAAWGGAKGSSSGRRRLLPCQSLSSTLKGADHSVDHLVHEHAADAGVEAIPELKLDEEVDPARVRVRPVLELPLVDKVAKHARVARHCTHMAARNHRDPRRVALRDHLEADGELGLAAPRVLPQHPAPDAPGHKVFVATHVRHDGVERVAGAAGAAEEGHGQHRTEAQWPADGDAPNEPSLAVRLRCRRPSKAAEYAANGMEATTRRRGAGGTEKPPTRNQGRHSTQGLGGVGNWLETAHETSIRHLRMPQSPIHRTQDNALTFSRCRGSYFRRSPLWRTTTSSRMRPSHGGFTRRRWGARPITTCVVTSPTLLARPVHPLGAPVRLLTEIPCSHCGSSARRASRASRTKRPAKSG